MIFNVRRRRESCDNISNSTGGSRTAIKTLSARSQMNLQRSGGPDQMAPALMNQLSLFGEGVPGSLWFSRLYLLLARWTFYLTGRIFSDQIAAHLMKLGEAAFLQGRTCWLDDVVENFVRKHLDTKTGQAVANVVVLGAGYDTRCYRCCLQERGVRCYEVDAAGTQAVKMRVLTGGGIDVGATVRVTCDFTTEDWLERLRSCGFDQKLPTCFVWEGVTMYLPRDTVKATMQKVRQCAKGSCIGFDYVDRTWAYLPKVQKWSKIGGEPWLFGMTGEEPEQLIAECNLTVWDHLKYDVVIERYLPKRADGRPIGYLDDFGGFLLAGIP
jgi:methyltransferase (TIGR00027 family)